MSFPSSGTWLIGPPNNDRIQVLQLGHEPWNRFGSLLWSEQECSYKNTTSNHHTLMYTHLLFLFTKLRLIQQVHTTPAEQSPLKSNVKTKKPPKWQTQLLGEGPSAGNGGRRWGGRAPGGGKPETWGICGGALGGGGGIPGIPPGGGGGMASVGGWAPRPVIRGGGRLMMTGVAGPPGWGRSFSILKWNWRKN